MHELPQQCDSCIWQKTNPLWDWSKEAVKIVALLTLILALSAQNFDTNEIIIIFAFASALGFSKFAEVNGWKEKGIELFKSLVTKK